MRRIKCFPSTLHWRNFITQDLEWPVILDMICVWEKLFQGNHIHVIFVTTLFWKNLRFQNVFHPQKNAKPPFLKFLRFKERFRKAPFSWRISVDGGPSRRKKAVFSNYSDVVLKTILCVTYKKAPLQTLGHAIVCSVIWIAEWSQIKLVYSPDVWCKQQNCLSTAGVD